MSRAARRFSANIRAEKGMNLLGAVVPDVSQYILMVPGQAMLSRSGDERPLDEVGWSQ